MKHLVEKQDRYLRWDGLPQLAAWVIEQGVAVQQIAAPTFAEGARAGYVAAQFRDLGLTDISTDAIFNVYGRLAGSDSSSEAGRRAILVSAHTDTVFAATTDLTVRREKDRIYAPGLGDNSIGVSGMLGLAWYLRQTGMRPPCDLWFVATSREEGLGDLGGMRAAYDRLRDQVGAVINLEGLAYGHVYHAGIAVRRLHITAAGSGGHSWLHFGRASAVHAIVALGGRIAALEPMTNPRTTFNIGMIGGGESINSIATHADLWLDMRSEAVHGLEKLETAVRSHIDAVHKSNGGEITFTIEVVGDRPAGTLDPKHPLIQGAMAALERGGVRGTLETGSTDANIPLSHGCPAVTIGITQGANAHRLDEVIETAPVAAGMRQFVTLVMAAAEDQR